MPADRNTTPARPTMPRWLRGLNFYEARLFHAIADELGLDTPDSLALLRRGFNKARIGSRRLYALTSREARFAFLQESAK